VIEGERERERANKGSGQEATGGLGTTDRLNDSFTMFYELEDCELTFVCAVFSFD
jgi:hypothetical protein